MAALSAEEIIQYSRQMILQEIRTAGQLKLKKVAVLCVGAGGIGSPALYYLAGAGIGRIGIIDPDKVARENLPRQILYAEADCGKTKVEIAKAKLEKINSHSVIESYSTLFSLENAVELASKYDIIIDGTDNYNSRYLINDAAFFAKKPLVSGSIYQFSGQISVFNYHEGPCYRCLYPEAPPDNLIPNCAESGVLGASTGMIGAMVGMEVIKIIVGIEPIHSGTLLDINTITYVTSKQKFNKRKNCQLCAGKIHRLTELCRHQTTRSCEAEKTINCEQLKTILANEATTTLLIDVRSKAEYELINLPGSLNIPVEEIGKLKTLIENAKPNRTILYCQKGIRSLNTLKKLNALGCQNIHSLQGGIESWLAS